MILNETNYLRNNSNAPFIMSLFFILFIFELVGHDSKLKYQDELMDGVGIYTPLVFCHLFIPILNMYIKKLKYILLKFGDINLKL